MTRLFSKPPRLRFITQSQPLYFVTFCTMHRKALLANSAVYGAFCQYAKVGMEQGAGVGQFVIMPEHVHLFVRMSGETALGRWVGGLKRAMGKAMSPVVTAVPAVASWEEQDAADTAATTEDEEARSTCSNRRLGGTAQLEREDAADTASASSGQAAATTGIQPFDVSRNLWQPGFFDHLLRHDESYSEKWLYVRENPIRNGLVEKWEDWPYRGEIVVIDRA